MREIKLGGSRCWLFLALTVVLAMVGGCGGGGDESSGGSSGLQYTGSTEQATIDNTNAEPLATNAYVAGQVTEAVFPVSMVKAAEGGGLGQPRTLALAKSFRSFLGKVKITAAGSTAAAAVETKVETVPGACGGSVTFSYSLDSQDATFSGTASFNNYCEDGTTISGSMNVSGQMDMLSDSPKQMSMTFNSLSATTATDSFTLSGSISITGESGDFSNYFTMTMNLVLSDNQAAKVYKLENVILNMTENHSGYPISFALTMEISGKFYHPDYGYIVITTNPQSPFKFTNDGDPYPSEGQMTMEGKQGTKARFTVLSATEYQVEADVNGDGDYDDPVDYNSGPQTWE